MPIITREVPWTTQPRQAAVVNRQHPVNRRLGFAWTPVETVVDLITRRAPSLTAGDAAPRWGMAGVKESKLSPTSANPGYGFGASHPFVTGSIGEFTFLVVIAGGTKKNFDTIFSARLQGGTFPSINIIAHETGVGQLTFYTQGSGSSTPFRAATSTGYWDGRPICIVGTISQANNTLTLYADGVLIASTTPPTTSVDLSGAGLHIGNLGSVGGLGLGTTYCYDGGVALAMAWNRSLSAAEVSLIGANPWQLFVPWARRVVIPGSGSNTNVSATKGALRYTGKISTVTRTNNQTVATTKTTLRYTGKVATVNQAANQSVAPSKGALTFTGKVSVVQRTLNQNISSVKGTLTYSGKIPTVSRQNNQTVSATKGILRYTGKVSGITQSASTNVSPAKGTLVYTGKLSSVTQTNNQSVASLKGSLTYSGKIPTITTTANVVVSATKGSLVYSGNVSTVIIAGAGAVFPDPSEVAIGVYYGPNGADFVGTLVAIDKSIKFDIKTGQLVKPLTNKLVMTL